MSTQLLEPILAGGIKNTNFFNGRLLTAEALREEQEANRLQRWQLGQAIGAGVVSGLYVSRSTLTTSKTVVHVTAGLALNRAGQALAISGDKELELVGVAPSAPQDAGLFAKCGETVTATTSLPTTVYILALCPASGFEGNAPMHGLTDQGTLNGCGRRFAVEGAKFKLVGLNLSAIPGISPATQTQLNTLLGSDSDDPARLSLLQNMLAYLCFGSEAQAGFAVDPFRRAGSQSAFASYGLVDAAGLDSCDVPLALIHLTTKGVRIVDNWAVRRRVLPQSVTPLWTLPLAQRRVAEGEAAFLQFQDQLSLLLQNHPATAASIVATSYFRYLPPVGLLPLSAGLQIGVNRATFFGGLPVPAPTSLEGAQLVPLIRASTRYPPTDLEQRAAMWLYQVRENDEAIAAGTPVQPYLVFTSGQMSGPGVDRYDINRWDFFDFS